jgi:cyclic lactone autoinducer peptide
MQTTAKSSLIRKLLKVLLKIAPVLANYRSSMFFWGETEIPESLQR